MRTLKLYRPSYFPGRYIKNDPKKSGRITEAVLSVGLDLLPHPGEPVSSVWGKVLGDTHL